MSVELCGIEVENLRGYQRASMALTRPITVLVGPNNAGKTSLLRLADWALNDADEALLSGSRALSSDEEHLLIPARNTRGGARRLVLHVRVWDGRRHQRFNASSGIARLRFRVRDSRVYLNIRDPTRSEPLTAEENAIVLLRELRSRTEFRLIPSSRDASSQQFQETLTLALRAKLSERAVHQVRGGAPGEYREVNNALTTMREVAERLAQPLWNEMQESVLALAKSATLTLDVDAGDLVDWMASRIVLKLVTGEHDPKAVFPVAVGSGLQSLLDLAVLRGEPTEETVGHILAIEEPEAFLHPAAQRALARALLDQDSVKRVISTHSPIVVDEAAYGDVVLVRDHKIFPPRQVGDENRAAINTALLTGQGSEAIFARSVLLVEGEGDRLFFERLRRRLAAADELGLMDQLAIVVAGSKTSFSPWIQLIEGYADEATGQRPIDWLVLADGIDAATDVAAAFRDAGLTVSLDIDKQLRTVSQAFSAGDENGGMQSVDRVNQLSSAAGLRMHLFPIDLEWAVLKAASATTVAALCPKLGVGTLSRDELLSRLGCKHGTGASGNPLKAPWTRGLIADQLPLAELSDDVRNVLYRWLRPLFRTDAAIRKLIRRTEERESAS
jgi:hypothetical protein